MTTRLTVTLPQLHEAQEAVAADPARFKVLAAGRRFGKTTLGVSLCLGSALQGGRTWWVSKSYKTAQEGWLYLADACAQIPGAKPYEADRIAEVPGGGTVEVRTAEEPGGLRGAGLDGLVFDEAAHSRESAWTQELRPALSDRHGWALFITTPNGKNWFHRLWEQAGHLPGWARWQLPSETNPHLDPAELDGARRELSAAIYAQEYGAEFLDLATVRPFRAEWLTEYETAPARDALWTVVAVDPAISKRDTACQTALVVAGVPLRGPERTTAYVLSADAGHWSPYETAGHILRLVAAWKARTVVIEDVAWQRALKDIVEREAIARGVPVPAVQLVKPELDKLRRALRVSPLVEGAWVKFGPGQAPLTRALLAVPDDESAWDYVDAFGLAIGALPLQAAPHSTLEPARVPRASRPDRRAISYAVTTTSQAARDADQIVTHRGPTVQWRSTGGSAPDRRRVAASYAIGAPR